MFNHPSSQQYSTPIIPVFYQLPCQSNAYQMLQNQPQQYLHFIPNQQFPYMLYEQHNMYNNCSQTNNYPQIYNQITFTQPKIQITPLQASQNSLFQGQKNIVFGDYSGNSFQQKYTHPSQLIQDSNEYYQYQKIQQSQETLQNEFNGLENNLKPIESPSSCSYKEVQDASTQLLQENISLKIETNHSISHDNCNFKQLQFVKESTNFKKRTLSQNSKINEKSISGCIKSQTSDSLVSNKQILSQPLEPTNSHTQPDEFLNKQVDEAQYNQQISKQKNYDTLKPTNCLEEKIVGEEQLVALKSVLKTQRQTKKRKQQTKVAHRNQILSHNDDNFPQEKIQDYTQQDNLYKLQECTNQFLRQSKRKLIKQPDALETAKQQEEQVKKQLIDNLTSDQREILRSAIQTNRQNINRNVIKQFKQFVNQKISYTLNYQKSSDQNYQYKSCKNQPITLNNSPTPQERISFSKKFNKFIASKQHSNNDIKQIIDNKIYGYLFLEFLTTDIDDWIDQNIDDKKSDYRCIVQFYILCCQQNQYLHFMNDNFSLNRKNIFYFKQSENQLSEQNIKCDSIQEPINNTDNNQSLIDHQKINDQIKQSSTDKIEFDMVQDNFSEVQNQTKLPLNEITAMRELS